MWRSPAQHKPPDKTERVAFPFGLAGEKRSASKYESAKQDTQGDNPGMYLFLHGRCQAPCSWNSPLGVVVLHARAARGRGPAKHEAAGTRSNAREGEPQGEAGGVKGRGELQRPNQGHPRR